MNIAIILEWTRSRVRGPLISEMEVFFTKWTKWRFFFFFYEMEPHKIFITNLYVIAIFFFFFFFFH